jgi:ring-1,2-phenylacetyl-CoA epoxidase subunit PaaD
MVTELGTLVDVGVAAKVVAAVTDPEIPVLTIEDLGILRDVSLTGVGRVTVTITPTYSGCPAMTQIRQDVITALARHGFDDAEVVMVHHPAWTTDWMSPRAREKLTEWGIAPPGSEVRCPRCASERSRTVSIFGSTACKALMVCSSCGEPFDHFKDF